MRRTSFISVFRIFKINNSSDLPLVCLSLFYYFSLIRHELFQKFHNLNNLQSNWNISLLHNTENAYFLLVFFIPSFVACSSLIWSIVLVIFSWICSIAARVLADSPSTTPAPASVSSVVSLQPLPFSLVPESSCKNQNVQINPQLAKYLKCTYPPFNLSVIW